MAEEAQTAKGLPGGKIQLCRNHYQREWYVEVKNQLSPVMLPGLLARLPHAVPTMVVAEYITPKTKKLLKEENIAYADAAGNMFLVDEQLYIPIAGWNMLGKC